MWRGPKECACINNAANLLLGRKDPRILSGTECSDCSNASCTWCGLNAAWWLSLPADIWEKPQVIITGKECLWHRDTTPSLRGLTGFHGFTIPTEYGFNESDSIWPLNTAHETQTHFIQRLKYPKKRSKLVCRVSAQMLARTYHSIVKLGYN